MGLTEYQTQYEKEHNDRAEALKLVFTAAELADFLHKSYRAADKALKGSNKHDHGFINCPRQEYFARRAQWLMEPLKNYNGTVIK